MSRLTYITFVLTGALALASGALLAADQDRTRDQARDQDRTQDQSKDQDRLRDRDRIYGSQLMTQKERAEYRSRIRAAKTNKEREQIRKEHHERMKVRAKERGVDLPDEPPSRGRMMGPGGSMSPGGSMGPAGGGGPGSGRNR